MAKPKIKRYRRAENPDSIRIDMQPFVGVMLVIVLFLFTVAVFSKERALNLLYPSDDYDMGWAVENKHLVVRVNRFGYVEVAKRDFTLGELELLANRLVSAGKASDATILATEMANVQDYVAVVDVLRKAGIENVGFVSSYP